ncbi:lysophospholipid acyltransferase family protein [Solilutibacter silvestris]|uniref:L-ornithine N(alpha)-acyltransferase n=1 Tax=Solilutibacter silvestris TaxID=1645665 RepID=A0A2K1PX80_9GAMM|nr:lysophospholipid acyltransferase family protein [Lysobacter silvestris]PNS07396.1 Acetyltransferase (GNAT) domain [Lysobacter silvestris]
MLQLEDRLQSRFPRWFHGRRAHVVRPLLRSLARWSRLDRIDTFLNAHADLRGHDFVRAGLDFLQVRYAIGDADLARIPPQGRLVIVANHPSGATDAFALLDAVGRVRRDVRIVANDFLTALEPLRDLLLPVRILGGRPSSDSLRAIEAALQREECVIVFPAGEVSRMSPRGIRDGRWRRGFLKFARAANAPVLPVHVKARNSLLFYGTSAMFKPVATALLAREMFARRNDQIRLRVGETMILAADAAPAAAINTVRRAVYALARRPRDGSEAATLAQESLAPSQSVTVIRDAVQALELLGRTSDGKDIRIGQLAAGSALLDEIGRLRELTFRMVGEGTGRRVDLDLYDSWYEHIVLWDAQAGRVVGAYRIARGARVLAERGLQGLYTASLFDYREAAIPHLAQGMELGRSFVAPDYWNSRSLDYLWQGIGAYLQRHADIRYLFGPVSISAALPVSAREQLVAYYSRFFGGQSSLATSRRPFCYFAAPPEFGDLDGDTAFRVLRANLDALGAQVPVLYKQYTELCEPGGARFLAFGVDPDFSNAVDGLIEVDLQRLRAKKRQRYLGAATPVPA